MAIQKEKTGVQLKSDRNAGEKDNKTPDGRREKQRQKERKRPGTPLKGAVAILLFFALLFSMAFCALTFNWFDVRGLTAEWLGVAGETSQRKEARLTDWETNLQRDAQKLADEQKNVKTAEQDVAGREAAVKKKEDELGQKMNAAEALNAQLQSKKNDITTVVKIIESMSADTAAAILAEIKDKNVMFSAFAQLKTATQAAILEELDAKAAASLLERLESLP